jgi:pantothenate kinase-related protein Tda10
MDSQIFHSTKSEMDEGNNKTRILGVCGGIGSGKSTACKMMVNSLGCIDRIGEYMRDLLFVVYTMFRNSFLFTTLSPGIKTRTF